MLPLLALAALSPGTLDRIASLDSANRLAERLVEAVNAGDSAKVTSMALPEFFERMPADQFPGLIQQVHGFGVLSPPRLILDLGEQRSYRVTVKREGAPDREILMVLGAESDSKFFSLRMSPYRELPKGASLKTDNPGKDEWDRAVQAAVESCVATFHPAALSVGVLFKNRESTYNYGEATPGKLPTASTIYEIGSITKTMTGLMLAHAIRDRKVKLDDDVRNYLPGKFENLEFNGRPITLRHLATHTSGLPASPPGIHDDGMAPAYERYSHEELLKDLAGVKLTRAPGAQFDYSNMGGGLVGLILEKAYGQPYEALLRKFILTPLKMSRTGIALTPAMDSNYATPHDRTGKPTDRWTINGIEGAGAVRSTIQDMLRFAKYNLNERNPDVGLSHTAQISGPPKLGLFWLTGVSRLGGSYVNHEGGTGGFTTHILAMPSKGLAVVVLMNGGELSAGDLAYEIALRLLYRPGAAK